jgi:hypothetical protein
MQQAGVQQRKNSPQKTPWWRWLAPQINVPGEAKLLMKVRPASAFALVHRPLQLLTMFIQDLSK